jgi:hypothetical protein
MMKRTEASFRFVVAAPLSRVAPLFGASGERAWAPGWAPRFVHPADERDEEGMVFTVRQGDEEAVWINTRLDLEGGVVEYAYVLPGVMATRIALRLLPEGERTHVEVRYQRTALRAEANARVERMAAEDRAAGPEWAQQITEATR